MQTPLLSTEPPPIEARICASCAWSRGNSASGPLFEGHDLAYCVQPDAAPGDGTQMVCQQQRFAESSILMHVCGSDGIFWTPRA